MATFTSTSTYYPPVYSGSGSILSSQTASSDQIAKANNAQNLANVKDIQNLTYDNNARQMALSNQYRTTEGATQGQMDVQALNRVNAQEGGATQRTNISEAGATQRSNISEAGATQRLTISGAQTLEQQNNSSRLQGEGKDEDLARARQSLNNYRQAGF